MRQPNPTPGQQDVAPIAIASVVSLAQGRHGVLFAKGLQELLETRVDAGLDKYGTLLQTHNGRDALLDAWQEAADCVMYLHQEDMEGEPVSSLILDAENLLIHLTCRLQLKEGK